MILVSPIHLITKNEKKLEDAQKRDEKWMSKRCLCISHRELHMRRITPTNNEDGKAEAKEEVELERHIVNNSDYQQSENEKLNSTDKDKKNNANKLLTGVNEIIGLSDEEIPIEKS